MTKIETQLQFKVSSALKNIIGKDLISDKFIAVFELVKNSYDAGARNVDIHFINNNLSQQIIISDDGYGMNYNDLISKWLFVAYSNKKRVNRHKNFESINREVAGAKGVGRFSCDRLGENLKLITKTASETIFHSITVNWNNFESDDLKEFIEIPVIYTHEEYLPSGNLFGTSLIINNLREKWLRDDILKLKRSLMKLISPEMNNLENQFKIQIFSNSEIEEDNKLYIKFKNENPLDLDKIALQRNIVNGIIYNDIFEKLNIKTTNIELIVSKDGTLITTKLTDRGQFMFSVTEKNKEYLSLKDIHCTLFYLNKSAKYSFTKQMGGIQPLKYGSVFIYKNGFRVNPYGEPGQDFFNIDQRKAQGFKRNLGTREIMGRISINGDNDDFIETSSRAHGFITTYSVEMLSKLFLEKALKVLEKYVVNIIIWGEPLKIDLNHTIEPSEVGDKIISQLLLNTNFNDIIDFNYNPTLFENSINDDDSTNIHQTIKKLNNLVELNNNENLLMLTQTIERRTKLLLEQNIEFEKINKIVENEKTKIEEEKTIQSFQIDFLNDAVNNDVKNLINGMHSIYTLTEANRGNITRLLKAIEVSNPMNYNNIFEIAMDIHQTNVKANKLSELAIKGNKNLKQTKLESISDFIREYLDSDFGLKGINYNVINNSSKNLCFFDTTSIGIIIDNISSNSIKSKSNKIDISFHENETFVEVIFTDNGNGIKNDIDVDKLFNWGFTFTKNRNGFGIGLYQIKTLIEEMDGKVMIDTHFKNGFRLVVSLRK